MNGQIVAAVFVELLLVGLTTLFLANPPWFLGEDKKLGPTQIRTIGYFLLTVTLVWSVIMGFSLAL